MQKIKTNVLLLAARIWRKIFKVPIDAGFDCPTVTAPLPKAAVHLQCVRFWRYDRSSWSPTARAVWKEIAMMHKEWLQVDKYIVYFQNFTNTTPVAVIRERCALPGVVGISIGTRPDCLPEDVVDYLAELNQRFYLWVEWDCKRRLKPRQCHQPRPIIKLTWRRRQPAQTIFVSVPIWSMACQARRSRWSEKRPPHHSRFWYPRHQTALLHLMRNTDAAGLSWRTFAIDGAIPMCHWSAIVRNSPQIIHSGDTMGFSVVQWSLKMEVLNEIDQEMPAPQLLSREIQREGALAADRHAL